MLNQAIQLHLGDSEAESISIDQLLSHSFSIQDAFSVLQSPELQQATYAEAVAIAQLSGITPAEEQRLAQIRHAFHIDADASELPDSASVDWADPSVSGRGIVLGMRRLISHSRQVRSLILDYAIGAAIIGLIPIPNLLLLKLLGLAVLVFKMLRDIGAQWGKPKGADVFAGVGRMFGCLGALAIAFMAWLTLFGLGLLHPSIRSLALGAGFSTFTWVMGQATNQYYMSSSRLDVSALRRVMQRQVNAQARSGWRQRIFMMVRLTRCLPMAIA